MAFKKDGRYFSRSTGSFSICTQRKHGSNILIYEIDLAKFSMTCFQIDPHLRKV